MKNKNCDFRQDIRNTERVVLFISAGGIISSIGVIVSAILGWV